MKITEIKPLRIRKCELIQSNDADMVQFIAVGDRHKMMKMEDGRVEIITLPEQGKEYRYGDPVSVEDAFEILSKGSANQRYMASQIKNHLLNQSRKNIPIAF